MGLKQFIAIYALSWGLYPVFAQVQQPLRVEVELESNDDHYMVMSMQENGIVLFRELAHSPEPRSRTWEVVRLDTLLQEVLTKNYHLEVDTELVGYEYRDSYFYLLFRMGQYIKDDLKIIKINRSKKGYGGLIQV